MVLFLFFLSAFTSCGGAFCHTVYGERKEGILDTIIETRKTNVLYEMSRVHFVPVNWGILILEAIESYRS